MANPWDHDATIAPNGPRVSAQANAAAKGRQQKWVGQMEDGSPHVSPEALPKRTLPNGEPIAQKDLPFVVSPFARDHDL